MNIVLAINNSNKSEIAKISKDDTNLVAKLNQLYLNDYTFVLKTLIKP